MPQDQPIRWTKHALTVLRKRVLLEEAVRETIEHPDCVERDRFNATKERRFRAVPEKEGRVRRVVCLETDEEVRILTALQDRRASKPAWA